MRRFPRRSFFFIFAAALHGVILFSTVFTLKPGTAIPKSRLNVMKLVDIREFAPPREPSPPPGRPSVGSPNTDTLAENLNIDSLLAENLSTDSLPAETVIEADKVTSGNSGQPGSAADQGEGEAEEFFPQHKVSVLPKFSEMAIRRALIYPPISLRAGIEGTVILELFVDSQGRVQRILVLKEDPPGKGFAEAAVKAFQGLNGNPAEANGKPVAVRFRYPVRFTIRGN
jgi:protein TonB